MSLCGFSFHITYLIFQKIIKILLKIIYCLTNSDGQLSIKSIYNFLLPKYFDNKTLLICDIDN